MLTGVSYFGNRYLDHARRDLDRLAGCCDYVVHTYSESDFQFHKAALSRIFEDTRKRGLELWVDPWGLGGVFGGEALSKFLLDHPETWQVLSNGKRVPAACLNNPAFQTFVRQWVSHVADQGAQVIFWDEPHVYFHWDLEWEKIYSCICPTCQELYKQDFGRVMPQRLDDDARTFRLRTLRGFLEGLMDYARRRSLRNALCLYAFEGYAGYEEIWNNLSSIPALDVFGSDPYWRWPPRRNEPPGPTVTHFAEKTVRSANGKGSQIWVQAMRLAKGKENEIEAACDAAVKAGITHLAAWSYDGGELLDTVLAEDPKKVWDVVEKIFKRIRE